MFHARGAASEKALSPICLPYYHRVTGTTVETAYVAINTDRITRSERATFQTHAVGLTAPALHQPETLCDHCNSLTE